MWRLEYSAFKRQTACGIYDKCDNDYVYNVCWFCHFSDCSRLSHSCKFRFVGLLGWWQNLFSENCRTENVYMHTPPSVFLRNMFATHVYLYILNTGVTVMKILKHEAFSIPLMCVSFNILYGNILYNSWLLIYFPILGEELIIASWKHDISLKWPPTSRN